MPSNEQVVVEFTADGSKLETGISGIERKVAQSSAKMNDALQFKGERVIKRNLRGFMMDMGSVGSATDLATSAVMRFGESLKVGLGAVVGMTVLFTVFKKIKDDIKEIKDSEDRLFDQQKFARLASQTPDYFIEQSSNAEKEEKLLQEKNTSQLSRFGRATMGVGETLGNAIGSTFQEMTGGESRRKVYDYNKESEQAEVEARQKKLEYINKTGEALVREAQYNADILDAETKGDEYRKAQLEASKKLEVSTLKLQMLLMQNKITLASYNDLLNAANSIQAQEERRAGEADWMRQAQLETESGIVRLRGTESEKKLNALRAEINLQRFIQTSTDSQLEKQRAANKEQELKNQLLDAEIAKRKMTPEQRAAEYNQGIERKRQERLDDLKARKGMSKADWEARRGKLPMRSKQEPERDSIQTAFQGLKDFFKDKTLVVTKK